MPASGYFKVALGAAHAIVSTTGGPETLAGYIVLREGAYGIDRRSTACGAKAIAKYTGCTDWRSKRVMDELQSLCFGDRGESWLIRSTGVKLRNAPIYSLGEWTGPDAYLPALLVKGRNDLPAPLHRICSSDEDPNLVRDALLLLLHLYTATDYGGWMGAPPDCFAYQLWDTSGIREVDDGAFELGCCGEIGGLHLWMVAPPIDDRWLLPERLQRELFAQDKPGGIERIRRALFFLLNSGNACKVASVTNSSRTYPLWVFNPSYRDALSKWHGVSADLASQFHRLACGVGADPDNLIIRAAASAEFGPDGTGVYFCMAKSQPIVRTLVIPRLHAPTPINMDGLEEIARTTTYWQSIVAKLRTKIKAAA